LEVCRSGVIGRYKVTPQLFVAKLGFFSTHFAFTPSSSHSPTHHHYPITIVTSSNGYSLPPKTIPK